MEKQVSLAGGSFAVYDQEKNVWTGISPRFWVILLNKLTNI